MSRATTLLLGLACLLVAVEIGTTWIEPYGLFHDELYYWACARRLGLGYVDHPPLAAWLLAGAMTLLGTSPPAFGLVPALCGAGTLLLTGRMARCLGAGPFGQLLAGLCVLLAPCYLAFFSFFSVNALEILLWTAACSVLVEQIRGGDERLWLLFGLVAGLALLNKHTFVLLGAGLAVGVLATPLRAQLASRWLWLGAALALLVALPNLYWNFRHDWPSLAFYRSVAADKNLPTTVGEALLLQVVGMNPAAVLVWLPGLLYLLFARAARPYRPLGVAFLALLLFMLVSGLRRADRIAGAYPVVLAAGAVVWERWPRRPWQRWIRRAVPALLVATSVLLLPVSLPVLPPQAVADYFEAIGESPEIEASDAGHGIPVHLLGRLEWERVADTVAAAAQALPAAERERAAVLAPHWVYASVVEFYGRERGLPPAVSPHNAYYFWRHEAAGRDVVLSIGVPPEVLDRHFAETRAAGDFRCEYCANWRGDMTVFVSRGLARPLEDLLGDWRHFGAGASPHLVR